MVSLACESPRKVQESQGTAASAHRPDLPPQIQFSTSVQEDSQGTAGSPDGANTPLQLHTTQFPENVQDSNQGTLSAQNGDPLLQCHIDELERSICERLDRIENSLYRLCPVAEGLLDKLNVVKQPTQDLGCPPLRQQVGRQCSLPDDDFSQRESNVVERESAPFVSLRSEWRAFANEGNLVEMQMSMDCVLTQSDERHNLDDYGEEFTESAHFGCAKPWWMRYPSTRAHCVWVATSLLLIIHDMAVVPVNLAFDTGDNVVSIALFWPSLLFWTMDIPLTFMTAIYRDGLVEVDPRVVALNYLRTWFLFDLVMVGCTWCEVFLEVLDADGSNLEAGRLGKSFRIMRIVRSLRALRFIKLREIIEDVEDHITSEHLHIVATLFKQLQIILWMSHFVACGWWSLGMTAEDENSSWIDPSYKSATLVYKYFTSLHWSLTQFTPASMEVFPRNSNERIYAVVVLLIAMIVFTSFLSSITSAMTALRKLTTNKDEHFCLLRRYLREQGIPHSLAVRIIRCVEHRRGERRQEIQAEEVQHLKLISKPLHMELCRHLHAPVLNQHPFFHRVSKVDPLAMQRICTEAVSRVCLSTGDALFTDGSSDDQLFFVLSGKLRYHLHATRNRTRLRGKLRSTASMPTMPMYRTTRSTASVSTHHSNRDDYMGTCESFLMEGHWCCEASLWSKWAHVGMMIATEMSEVLAVHALSLAAVVGSHRLLTASASRYGAAFAQRLNAACADGHVSDLPQIDVTALEEFVEAAFGKARTPPVSEGEEIMRPVPMAAQDVNIMPL